MRFLIDASPPRSLASALEKIGHGAIDVRDIGLGAAEDMVIAARARVDKSVLITRDFDFADVRNYPPAGSPGIVVVNVPTDISASTLVMIVAAALNESQIISQICGRLVIIEPGRVRVRKI